MCQFFYCLDIFFKQNVNEIFYIVRTLYILWWSTKWSSLNQISSNNPFSIDAKIRASLCIINKEMKDVFVCYAREEEEEKRKYIAVEAAWPPRSCCFFYAMFYIKLWNSNYKADTICRFISINMLLIFWLLPGVKAILTNFTSSAAVYIWSFFPILLTVVYCWII